ncbi:concanavalin A-like lectin/glucanase domain-containing protein [Xylogone sp. PMI_703]|nr:concanavalin A-like lectin/glucanase domain-containing protein [Xylogone sp. PMI_703]
MAPSLLLRAGAVALACANTVSATTYTLAAADHYEGANFFDLFNFNSGADPNNGYVDYQSYSSAVSKGLVSSSSTQITMRVDSKNVIPNGARGRPAVRIESKKKYNHGLFIADIAHMPSSTCGVWPAFWTVGLDNYPAGGEIDILENINEQVVNLETLHTTSGCTVTGRGQTAAQTSFDCDNNSQANGQSVGQACSATNSQLGSYGTPFNTAGGGIYAMEWTSSVISIWFFTRAAIPSDIKAGTPNPSNWGLPSFTTAGGNCNIDQHFKDHQIIFDTTFCGGFAGQDVFWKQTSCYKANPVASNTCNNYVQNHPSAFADAYWAVNSVKVYQLTNPITTTTKKTTTTTTTHKTTTTTKKTTTTTTTKKTTTTVKPSTTTKKSTTTTVKPSTTTKKSTTTVKPSTTTKKSTTTTVKPTSTIKTTTQQPTTKQSRTSKATTSADPSTTVQVTSSDRGLSTSPVLSSSSHFPTTHYSNSTTSSARLTTKTIYTETTYTITSCAATVTDCPGRIGQVTTDTIILSTTICPVTETETPAPSATATSAQGGNAGSGNPAESTISTVYTTRVYTITSCAPTVTDCPARIGQVTTDIVSLYTTICPVTAAEGAPSSAPVYVAPSAPAVPSYAAPSSSAAPPSAAPSSPAAPPNVAPAPSPVPSAAPPSGPGGAPAGPANPAPIVSSPPVVVPGPVTISKVSNGTSSQPTGALPPASTPSQFVNGADGMSLRFGSAVLMGVMGLLAALM